MGGRICPPIRDRVNIIIKKKMKKINLSVHFLPFNIAFFGGFENYNKLSWECHTRRYKLK